MFDVDWKALFVPSGSLLEIFIRGTVIYLALFLAMRLLPRRTIGAMGPSDLLVIVIIADAVQNAMAGSYKSVTEGLLLAAVIFGWATLIDWIDFHYPDLHLAEGPPVPVIRNGRIARRNLRAEQVTEDELMSQLRLHGVKDVAEVRSAYIEGDGHMSVLLKDGKRPQAVQGKTL